MAVKTDLKTTLEFLQRVNLTTGQTSTPFDLAAALKGKGLVAGLQLRFAFTATAAGGGNMSGLTADAPLPYLASRISMPFNYSEVKGIKNLFNGPGVDAYYLDGFKRKILGIKSAPTPTAGNSSNGQVTIRFPLADFANRVYIDPRSVTLWTLAVTVGALADYASTNVASITAVTMDIYAEIVEGSDLPPRFSPHFLPWFESSEGDASATSTRNQIPGGLTGGFLASVLYRTRDNSASADAQRVNGLVRELSARAGSVDWLKVTFQQLWEKSREQAALNLSGSGLGSHPDGVALWTPDEDMEVDGMADLRETVLVHVFDTSSALPVDVTAITPNTNDRLFITGEMWAPNYAQELVLSGKEPAVAYLLATGQNEAAAILEAELKAAGVAE